MSINLSSIAATLTAVMALEADAKALYALAGQTMQTVEALGAKASGADKKTAVLNIVSLAAAELGHDFAAIAPAISAFIDGAKTLYNAVVGAVTPAQAPVIAGPQL